MDKNTIFGFLLITAILVVFSIVNKPSQEELETAKRRRDSLALVQQQEYERLKKIEEEEKLQALQTEPVNENDSSKITEIKEEYGAFYNTVLGEEKFYTLENDLLKLTISNKGGKIYSVELKDYKTHDSLPLILFNGDSTKFGLNFFAQRRSISTNDLYFTPTVSKTNLSAASSPETFALRLNVDADKYLEYKYTVEPGSYMVDFDINAVGLDNVIDQNIRELELDWEMYVPQKEKGKQNENIYTTILYKHYEDEVERFNGRSNKEVQSADIPTRLKWIAFKGQFFSSVLIADESFQNAQVQSVKLPDEDKFLKNFSANIGIPYNGTPSSTIPMKFYFGPNHFNTLKQYDDLDLKELVNLGGYLGRIINQFVIIPIFNLLDNFIGNYGLIILILTIIIKLVLFPLTFKSYQSQAKMRVLKPQIDEINERIPKEKAMERQQATMALYKKVGINPMGGCLPMLLQMPILFAMFRFFPSSIELRQESFLWAHDLSTYDAILEWNKHIPLISDYYGNHISLFTLLMTVSTMFSMKFNSSTTSSAQMPGMQGMMYIMPIMFMFVLNNYSAGLTYYYFLANMITLGQNAIFKAIIDEDAILKKLEAKKAKPQKKSKFQQRLEEAAKQRGYKPPKR